MQEVNRRIDQARRRLAVRAWLERAAWCVFVGLCVALVAVAAPKAVAFSASPEGFDGRVWNLGWLAGGAAAGLLAAVVWGFVRPTTREHAAVEIDRRYGLRERVASSLAVETCETDSEAAAALARDAERAVARVDVAERFGVAPSARAWLPFAPALAALLVIALVGNRTAESSPTPDAERVSQEEVKAALEKARKEMARRREEAEKKGLADATGLLKEVEKGADELARKAEADKTEALVKLNDLAKRLEKRRAELGGAEALRKQLNDMKDLGGGPAKKAAAALARGDYKAAMEELAKLEKQIANGTATPEQREKLASQLGKMSQKLAAAAEQHKQRTEELEKQAEEARRRGDLARAGELQQKLDQMNQQAPQMQQLEQMAQQMAKAQQALEQGDAQQAAQAMSQMQQQMEQLAQQAEAMDMLDAAMTDIEMAKAGMGAQPMPGAGGQPMGGFGANGFGEGQLPGPGMGEGRGAGPRPDEKNPTSFRDTSVKQDVGRGASTFGGLVRGRSIKGEVAESIKEELSTTNVAPADPLTSERLPRSRREHAEDYFKRLREEL